jgi:hypothetical protein
VFEELKKAAQEIAAHGAADAAIVHLYHLLLRFEQEVMVNADLPELVDDHADTPPVIGGKNPIEQRRFARAQEPGQDDDGRPAC